MSATLATVPGLAPSHAPPTSARDAALRVLAQHARHDPDLHPIPLDDQGLAPRDRALAHAIVDHAVRRWGTIEFLLGDLLKRPFAAHTPVVRAGWLGGAAQLLFFDRLPVHAVVDETVGWVRGRAGAGSAGLVNATLRALARRVAQDDTAPARREAWSGLRDELPLADGGARVLTEPILPEDTARRLAVATGLAPALIDHLARDHTEAEVRGFALHGVARPAVILNTAHVSAPLPMAVLEPHACPGHHVYTGPAGGLESLLASRADIWAQDPASSAAVHLVAGQTPRLIVDLCAGRGTKTRQLRALFPDADLVATDIKAERRSVLDDVFRTDPGVSILAPDDLLALSGGADLVLVDAPCSNTGVLGRRIEARRRWSDGAVGSLVEAQRQALVEAIRLRAPDGVVVYSTCSVDCRENMDQADWLSRWHGLTVMRAESRWPAGGPGRPSHESADGSFAVFLR